MRKETKKKGMIMMNAILSRKERLHKNVYERSIAAMQSKHNEKERESQSFYLRWKSERNAMDCLLKRV